MGSLQPRLHLKVSQRQVLTPGLVQMVSVLALNSLELREMINAEIVENPILEELDDNGPSLEDTSQREDMSAEPQAAEGDSAEKKDSFDEIDFGSYFQDYLDPGYRTHGSMEVLERPAFENFLSQAGSLSDHLQWQLSAISMDRGPRAAVEMIIGNLDEDGYLTASEAELVHSLCTESGGAGGLSVSEDEAAQLLRAALAIIQSLDPPGVAARDLRECLLAQIAMSRRLTASASARRVAERAPNDDDAEYSTEQDAPELAIAAQASEEVPQTPQVADADSLAASGTQPEEGSATVASDDASPTQPASSLAAAPSVFDDAHRIVADHLGLLQKRDLRDLARAMRRPAEALADAVALIRSLDPRPGRRYNREEARLIEPDVAIVKRDDTYVSFMNDDNLPSLRLNQGYRRMLTQEGTDREVRNYIKERYKSAIQLMRNIEQRKATILRVCDVLIRRQKEFFEKGVEALHPMMIKDVAEEIGVHPSTVSRAVSNKYVHTPQGVFELRFFFSEAVNGPEGGGTPLMLLKRRVKKIIEEEDANQPLTDDAIAKLLEDFGIRVTRRTVAKYREDLHIPSTHQRRVRKHEERTS